MARLNADRSEKFPPERGEQPAFYLRSIANLVRALGENKESLLSQITRFRFVLGQ
jgi:hypothetical protein